MKGAKGVAIMVSVWICAVLALFVCGPLALWLYVSRPATDAGHEIEAKIRVPEGTMVRQVAHELKSLGLIRSEKAMYLAARFRLYGRNEPFSLKSGVYNIQSTMSLRDICTMLQTGAQEYITAQIPEGLTMAKIARRLEDAGVCDGGDFLSACRSDTLLLEFGIPAKDFEGYLFPDTYFFTPNMDATAVVRRLAGTFFERVKTIPALKDCTPDQLHDTLILASIVEREYRVPSEAPVIASVFTNRLEHGIGLYSCATIEYIITEIEGRPHPERITYEDLKLESPYNTYRWAGLPPGPISNPGMVALDAAANPAQTDYFYFVLTDADAGSHTFSTSFDAHKAAENASLYTKRTPDRR